tara:strand:- start:790 stop:1056 length:267 start_codon:yes stop_codon:yes gene_type:complete
MKPLAPVTTILQDWEAEVLTVNDLSNGLQAHLPRHTYPAPTADATRRARRIFRLPKNSSGNAARGSIFLILKRLSGFVCERLSVARQP